MHSETWNMQYAEIMVKREVEDYDDDDDKQSKR